MKIVVLIIAALNLLFVYSCMKSARVADDASQRWYEEKIKEKDNEKEN